MEFEQQSRLVGGTLIVPHKEAEGMSRKGLSQAEKGPGGRAEAWAEFKASSPAQNPRGFLAS